LIFPFIDGVRFSDIEGSQGGGVRELKLDFSGSGKPTNNPFIESVNGKFRVGCLNENRFLSLADDHDKIARWRDDYNRYRLYSSLGDISLMEVKERYIPSASPAAQLQGYNKAI
jgi:putative transposase